MRKDRRRTAPPRRRRCRRGFPGWRSSRRLDPWAAACASRCSRAGRRFFSAAALVLGHGLHSDRRPGSPALLQLGLGLAPFADGPRPAAQVGVFLRRRTNFCPIELPPQAAPELGIAGGDLVEFLEQSTWDAARNRNRPWRQMRSSARFDSRPSSPVRGEFKRPKGWRGTTQLGGPLSPSHHAGPPPHAAGPSAAAGENRHVP